jgi:hypothetical protein
LIARIAAVGSPHLASHRARHCAVMRGYLHFRSSFDCTLGANDDTINIFGIIAVYLDEIFIYNTYGWIFEFKISLASQFDIKDLEPC